MRVTDAENYALNVLKAKDTMTEFFGPRADDSKAKAQLYHSIYNNGYAQLSNIESDIESKQSLNAADVYFLGASLKTNLVTDSMELLRTQNNRKKKEMSHERYTNKE